MGRSRRHSRPMAMAQAVMGKAEKIKLNRSGRRPGRPAGGGRSAVNGKRCSGAVRADRDSSSVLRRVARRVAGQQQECGAEAGIGGGCGQNRGLCAPSPGLRRRSGRRQGTRRVPAPAPERRAARPASPRRQQRHPPRRQPLLRLMRQAVRRQEYAGCRLRRRRGHRRDRLPCGRLAAIRRRCPLFRLLRRSVAVRVHAKYRFRRRSGHPRDRLGGVDIGTVRQCRGRRLRRRGSGERGRWSATCGSVVGLFSGR